MHQSKYSTCKACRIVLYQMQMSYWSKSTVNQGLWSDQGHILIRVSDSVSQSPWTRALRRYFEYLCSDTWWLIWVNRMISSSVYPAHTLRIGDAGLSSRLGGWPVCCRWSNPTIDTLTYAWSNTWVPWAWSVYGIVIFIHVLGHWWRTFTCLQQIEAVGVSKKN